MGITQAREYVPCRRYPEAVYKLPAQNTHDNDVEQEDAMPHELYDAALRVINRLIIVYT
jgi:hypothetical protein